MNGRTVIHSLHEHAVERPSQAAYIFLEGEALSDEKQLTYAQLLQRVQSVASFLTKQYAPESPKGHRVLLVYPPGLDFICAFLGCLYCGVIAIPTYPPASMSPSQMMRDLKKIATIVDDAQADYALTTSTLALALKADVLAPLLGGKAVLQNLKFQATDKLHLQSSLRKYKSSHETSPDDVAFLQYSSGSTGNPKGIQVLHKNLLHNCTNCSKVNFSFSDTKDPIGLIWLPPYHDMGLIGGLLTVLLEGVTLITFSPLAFLKDPPVWIRLMSKYKVTHTGTPNFALDLVVRKMPDFAADELDLSQLRCVCMGGETNRAESMERFYNKFKSVGIKRTVFSPGYALAENTLTVCVTRIDAQPRVILVDKQELEREAKVAKLGESAVGGPFDADPIEGAHRLVSAGAPVEGVVVAITQAAVDSEGGVTAGSYLPEASHGEIWVAGKSVTNGYFKRDSGDTFNRTLANAPAGLPKSGWLATGDLGFMLDEELYITGRSKDLIIIGGRNLHPQDLEKTTAGVCEAALRPGCIAAFSITSAELSVSLVPRASILPVFVTPFFVIRRSPRRKRGQ
jgi:acyl-CoA synthetase (AMP-forming)/AMP-acid ligase II